MQVLLWIVLGVVGVYLVLVIPAGVAVLVSEIRFRRSPHRDDILAIIERYKQQIRASDQDARSELVRSGLREHVEKDGVSYSVDITGKKLRDEGHEFVVSVGRLHRITIGHAEKFVLKREG